MQGRRVPGIHVSVAVRIGYSVSQSIPRITSYSFGGISPKSQGPDGLPNLIGQESTELVASKGPSGVRTDIILQWVLPK